MTHSPKVSEQINEEELLRRLIDRFHKLDCGHISSLSEYYLAHHFAMIGHADVLEQFMNKQARGATTIMNCVDPKFQNELRVPQTDGTTDAEKMASLFVKHLLKTFFGRDGSVIATQADQIQKVFRYYTTVVDFHHRVSSQNQ